MNYNLTQDLTLSHILLMVKELGKYVKITITLRKIYTHTLSLSFSLLLSHIMELILSLPHANVVEFHTKKSLNVFCLVLTPVHDNNYILMIFYSDLKEHFVYIIYISPSKKG